MNWLDAVIILLLVLIGVSGWVAGIIRSFSVVVGAGGGVYVAWRYHWGFAKLLSFIGYIENHPAVGTVIAVFTIFSAVFLIAIYLGVILRRRLYARSILGWIDRLVGTVMGVIGCSLIFTVVILNASLLPFDTLGTSISGSSISQFFANSLAYYLPQGIKSLLPVEEAQQLDVRVGEIGLGTLADRKASLNLWVKIKNPNAFGVNVAKMEYEVDYYTGNEWLVLGEGEYGSLKVSGKAETLVSLPVKVTHPAAVGTLFTAQDENSMLKIRVKGNALVRFPITDSSYERTFTVTRDVAF